jgi:ATP/maltotriose-dependent transcriptional regulator MalT
LHAEQRRAEEEIRQAQDCTRAASARKSGSGGWSNVIEGEVNQALREFERQARAAAEAERFRQQQDLRTLQVELLREQGREAPLVPSRTRSTWTGP